MKFKKKHHIKPTPSAPAPNPVPLPAPAASEPKSEEAQGAPRVGTEAWLKLIVVVLAFLFLSGHSAQKAFTQFFNLQPEDFTWSERDYLIHGMRYLLPDAHHSFSGWGEYLKRLPWHVWGIYGILMPLIFMHRGKSGPGHWRRWGATTVRSVLILGLALLLDVASAREGLARARRINRSDLPLVIVFFQNPACETNTFRLEGKLLSRNEKTVFVVDPVELRQCSYTETNFTEGQLILVPADKVVRLVTELPHGSPAPENQ